MIHPKTELKHINNDIGFGVVATELLPAGTITWVFDHLDREFTPSEYQKMNSLHRNYLETYMYRNRKGNFIFCWDNGKYMNHSFNSNCISTAYNFEIAIRDIHPGEQLTNDYGYLNIIEPFTGIDEGTERKTVYPNDLVKYHKIWDKQIQGVFKKIPELKQELKTLIEDSLWDKIGGIVKGTEQLDSIYKNYFDEKLMTN